MPDDVIDAPDDDTINTSPDGDQADQNDDLFDDDDDVDTSAKDGAKDDADDDMLSDDDVDDQGGVPDQYAFDPPEGLDVDEDMQARLDQFAETAKGLKLTQEQYQGLVEYDLERSQQLERDAVDDWNERVQGWRSTAKADKEIGGSAFEETKGHVMAALQQFGTPGLSNLLKSPSPENPQGLALRAHPEVLRFLSRVGKAIADPSLIEGGNRGPATTTEERMFPTMRKEKT